MSETLETAAAGDTITADQLQASIDLLRAMASMLRDRIDDGMSVADIQAIGRAHADLMATASSLVDRQIDLLAGEAKVTAEHINAATAFADSVIRKIANVKQALAKVASVLSFFAAVLTGNGKTIVQAAVALKKDLA